MKINRVWLQAIKMPKNKFLEEHIKWHLEQKKNWGHRNISKKIKIEMKKKDKQILILL